MGTFTPLSEVSGLLSREAVLDTYYYRSQLSYVRHVRISGTFILWAPHLQLCHPTQVKLLYQQKQHLE
jgi:hypothetical protein